MSEVSVRDAGVRKRDMGIRTVQGLEMMSLRNFYLEPPKNHISTGQH